MKKNLVSSDENSLFIYLLLMRWIPRFRNGSVRPDLVNVCKGTERNRFSSLLPAISYPLHKYIDRVDLQNQSRQSNIYSGMRGPNNYILLILFQQWEGAGYVWEVFIVRGGTLRSFFIWKTAVVFIVLKFLGEPYLLELLEFLLFLLPRHNK